MRFELPDKAYMEVDLFAKKIYENWKEKDIEDAHFGVLASDDGKSWSIKIGDLQLEDVDADQTRYFLDLTFELFVDQQETLQKIYGRIHQCTEDQNLVDSLEWQKVADHLGENQKKISTINSIQRLIEQRIGSTSTEDQEEYKRTLKEIKGKKINHYELKEIHQNLISRIWEKAKTTEEKLQLFPHKIELLLNESSEKKKLATNKAGMNALHFAAMIGDISVIKKADEALDGNLKKHINKGNPPPLTRAIMDGAFDYAKALIEAGADINAADNSLYTPLHTSINWDNPDQVTFCLKQDHIDLVAREHYRETPLHLAAEKGNPEILKMLLAKKEIYKHRNNRDLFGRTALDIAMHQKNDEAIKILMEDPNFDVEKLPGYGKGPTDIKQRIIIDKLHSYLKLKNRDLSIFHLKGHCHGFGFLAQYYQTHGKAEEYFQVMELFSKWDGSEESLKSKEGIEALSGNYRDLEDLMEQWVNDIVWFQHDLKELDPYLFELQNQRIKQFETVKKFPEEKVSEIMSRTRYYQIPREQLAEILEIWSYFPGLTVELGGSNHTVSLKILPDGKVSYYDSNMPYRLEPFESMAELAEIIQNTKHRALGKVWKKMYEEIHVYFMATEDKKEVPEFSQTVPSTFLERNSANQFNPLHFAIFFNDEQLLSKALNDTTVDVNAKDVQGETPIKLAVQLGREKLVVKLLKKKDIKLKKNILLGVVDRDLFKAAKALLESKHQVNINYLGGKKLETALHNAIMKRDKQMINLLLFYGADPTPSSFGSDPAISEIADIQDPELLDFIIIRLNNLNITDNRGNNLLHYAIVKGNLQLIKKLIDQGVDVSIKDSDGRTPLQIAKDIQNEEIIDLLNIHP